MSTLRKLQELVNLHIRSIFLRSRSTYIVSFLETVYSPAHQLGAPFPTLILRS